jgi:hypothetical protein
VKAKIRKQKVLRYKRVCLLRKLYNEYIYLYCGDRDVLTDEFLYWDEMALFAELYPRELPTKEEKEFVNDNLPF